MNCYTSHHHIINLNDTYMATYCHFILIDLINYLLFFLFSFSLLVYFLLYCMLYVVVVLYVVAIASYFVYVCTLYFSGKEERPWPIARVQ